jgi:predicted ribosomally synthesized peptide with nif11-like leader
MMVVPSNDFKMTSDQLNAFVNAVSSDKALQNKIQAATDAAVLAIAKEEGYVLTLDACEAAASNELSDAQLETVAGGGKWSGAGQMMGGITQGVAMGLITKYL